MVVCFWSCCGGLCVVVVLTGYLNTFTRFRVGFEIVCYGAQIFGIVCGDGRGMLRSE
jgi:hypothetical protein